jgi:hypothetical protein
MTTIFRPNHRMAEAVINDLVDQARWHGRNRIELRATDGRLVGHIELYDHAIETRPKDLPRRLRPKERLSKRQRDKAKREKLERERSRT